MKITRDEYMNNSEVLHQSYYAQFVTQETIKFVESRIGLKKLLESKCKYFNDIGIKHSNGGRGGWLWDNSPINLKLLRECGGVSEGYMPSPATYTSIGKVAARMLVDSHNKEYTMNYFINFDPNFGLSINTYRNNGYLNDEIGGLVDDIIAERMGNCSLEGALETLEDGHYWQGSNATIEIIEELHNLIKTHEKSGQ